MVHSSYVFLPFNFCFKSKRVGQLFQAELNHKKGAAGVGV